MMNETLLGAVLLLLLGLGILVVVTDRLFTAVVYSAALSACIAFGYLLLGAPDVALAEAIIGSALTTVIYLATLKKSGYSPSAVCREIPGRILFSARSWK